MRNVIYVLMASAGLLMGATVNAQAAELTDQYVGAGIGSVDLPTGTATELYVSYGGKMPGVIEGELDDKFGVEARAGTSTSASQTLLGVSVKSSINYYLGGYATLKYPVAKKINAYGLLGLSYISVKAESAVAGKAVSATATTFGLSWGIGASYDLNRKIAVGVELFEPGDGHSHLSIMGRYAL